MPKRRASVSRVLIAHSAYGGSSKAAAEALAAGLKDTSRPVSVETIDFLEQEMPSMSVLARFAYQQTAEFFPGVTGRVAGAPSDTVLVEELQQRGVEAAGRLWESTGASAVVSTCPIVTAAFAESRPGPDVMVVAVVVDHSARHLWLHPGVDLYFVPSSAVRDELVVHGSPYDRIVVSGIPVHGRVMARGSRSKCAVEIGLTERFTVAVEGAGILGPERRDVVSSLASAGLQTAAMAAGEPRLRRRLDQAAQATGLVAVVTETRRYGSAIGASDVMVTSAGSPRVNEALAAGLPVVLYNPVPAREVLNADFLVNSGAALLARDEGDVVEKCRFLAAHPERRGQLAAAAAALGRPSATRAICDRVTSVL